MEQLWSGEAVDAEKQQKPIVVVVVVEEEDQISGRKIVQRVQPERTRRGGQLGSANGANRSFGLCHP
jgi:hypothetical protein